MKVKKLLLGEIAKIEYKETSMEGYSSWFDNRGYFPAKTEEGLFYKIGNHVFDVTNFKGYKLVPRQERYSSSLSGKTIVIYNRPFSDYTLRTSMPRKEAILVYQNRVIK